MKRQMVRLHAAAFIFSKNPTIPVSQLALTMGVSEGAIYRWARRPEWDAALDALGYTGERAFHREPRRSLQRESGETVEQAFTLIDQLTADGLTEKKAVTRAASVLELPRRRLYEWNKKRKQQ